MKKFIIAVCAVVLLAFAAYTAYYRFGIYVDLHPDQPVTTFMKTEGKSILMEREGRYVPFEIRGVNMGVGIPGEWATDYAIDKETYLRWFGYIQEMGANTVRVYIALQDDFYNAFYEYNLEREENGKEPLWLLHGVWVNDYMQNSHRDAYDEELLDVLIQDSKTVIDILHGQKVMSLGRGLGSGSYRHDVSRWVIGYILGVEWESTLVAYTNQTSVGLNSYDGEYLYTTEKATPFEAFLCRVGDGVIRYESSRYKQQRLVAFSNWPTTDPFSYPVTAAYGREKYACVDVEQIKSKESFQSGLFASYHVYPYFPDYLELIRRGGELGDAEVTRRLGATIRATLEYRQSKLNAPSILDYVQDSDYYDHRGRYNTYIAYLRALNQYHTLPVVISEYGVSTGRGMAQEDINTGRNQGHMTEQEQGQAIIDCYRDIMDAGCVGSCIFTWQDEWFKRTWNTMHAIDLDKTPYWSDYQTNEQYFGLLAFDPGKEESICYVDGDLSEWGPEDLAASYMGMELSVKYDEKFIYFLVKKPGFKQLSDTIYIPIDTTQKTGSTYCQNYDITFERACDFLVVIHGRGDSRVIVQQRYEALRSTFAYDYYPEDPYVTPPEKDTPVFINIYLPLIQRDFLRDPSATEPTGTKFDTGALRYGNANPDSEDFDSLADFIFSGDYVEIRLPWQLLNFSNPSEMMVHNDYYEHYGIENLHIDEMYVGIGCYGETKYRIPMSAVTLKGWGKKPTYHERLKRSYYILQDYWASLDAKR